ncbi:MAG: fructosamine kinase family protein [Methyloligellaceae bacterium]
MSAALISAVETALHARVVQSAPMAVGFGLTGLQADLADGRSIAVKAGAPERADQLELEAYMLRELARLSDLPVPQVLHAGAELLVMSWIDNDGAPITADVERNAAELLAALHAEPREAFGYGRDTVIGPLAQPNRAADEWVPFFREHRLLHMAETARLAGALPVDMHARIGRLAHDLDRFLTEPRHPALIHGDLWTGNVLVRGRRIAGFVDPAIYVAHPEIELAFTTMFNTFGRPFFDAYEALAPLEPGFHEVRRELYNLYPTLVHVRLFGAGYLDPIDRTLRQLGF